MTNKIHDHHLSCHVHKGKATGVYIAHIVEIPGIIVYSKTKEEIKPKVVEALSAYFDAFPEQHDIIFSEQPDQFVQEITVQI